MPPVQDALPHDPVTECIWPWLLHFHAVKRSRCQQPHNPACTELMLSDERCFIFYHSRNSAAIWFQLLKVRYTLSLRTEINADSISVTKPNLPRHLKRCISFLKLLERFSSNPFSIFQACSNIFFASLFFGSLALKDIRQVAGPFQYPSPV